MTDFHEIYVRYAEDIYRFAIYLCGDKDMAEDITAETFSRALTSNRPIVSATVKGYLLTIARNLYLESLRRGKKFSEMPNELHDSKQNLESAVNQKLELEDLLGYLQNFTEVDRTALLMRVDGVSYNEIAKALDISLASAKVKVHRMRLKLAEWRINRKDYST